MERHSWCVVCLLRLNSHLKTARAEEAAEQVSSLGEQFTQKISLHHPATHGAVQHPPAIGGQAAHILLPVTPTNAVEYDVCSPSCEITMWLF